MKKTLIFLFSFVVLFADGISSQIKLIDVECSDISLTLRIEKDSDVSIVYFGKKFIEQGSLLNKHFLYQSDSKEEYNPLLYPAYGGRIFTEPILKVTHSDGNETCNMKFKSVSRKQINGNVSRTIIYLSDNVYKLDVSVIFDAFKEENVITQQVRITNSESKTIFLNRFYSSYLPVFASKYFITHFNGTWANEMQLNETLLSQGTTVIESKKGVRATQSENPSFVISLDHEAQPNYGEIIIGALAWSGNFKINFEVDESKRLNILGGINPFASEIRLEAGKTFSTPAMIWTYSNSGYGQASRNLHDWSRKYALRGGDKVGSVVLNSWEGAYFNFNEATIKKMIDDAATIGVETFVLDDGWFGNEYPRNSDKQGLGDWEVNLKKLPKGIHDLASYAVSKGLKFGIWIEPEMVNPQSNLAKQKPGWIVKSPNREIPTLRNQWLLDLSNPDVQEYVYNVFRNTILLSPNISYVKWDANRHVESFGSTYLPSDKQSHFWTEYVNGLYNVYERICHDFPNIEIQLCSSGGGRLDYGALRYHNEFWTSDNTDPYQRLKIQFATNLIYPPKATAAHVSESPNHQTKDVSPLKFRFHVAMMGRLGVELQPTKLSQQDIDFIKNAISQYKSIRHIVNFGDWVPLHSPYFGDDYVAIQYVTKDKKESLLFTFSTDYHPRTYMPVFKMEGLNKDAMYQISEICTADKSSFCGNNLNFSGDYLMNAGVNLNLRLRGESSVFYIRQL